MIAADIARERTTTLGGNLQGRRLVVTRRSSAAADAADTDTDSMA